MAIKVYNPTTAARRKMSTVVFSGLTKKEPERKLLRRKIRSSGRNDVGHLTVRHRGGGSKRHYRLIDFDYQILNVTAKVISLEYDPNRTSFIALVCYQNGEKKYIIAPENLKVGAEIITAKKAKASLGNRCALRNIPIGTGIYNVELSPGRGSKLVRSAGVLATVLAKENDVVHLRLPSSEVRIIPADCFASIGQVSNVDHENVRIGKAGRVRYSGRRPQVRGKAMNPVDHPHGGGEGGSPIGLKHPKTPTGMPALGYKTRKRNKFSNRYIVKRRHGEKIALK